jgi:hypothetical protein
VSSLSNPHFRPQKRLDAQSVIDYSFQENLSFGLCQKESFDHIKCESYYDCATASAPPMMPSPRFFSKGTSPFSDLFKSKDSSAPSKHSMPQAESSPGLFSKVASSFSRLFKPKESLNFPSSEKAESSPPPKSQNLFSKLDSPSQSNQKDISKDLLTYVLEFQSSSGSWSSFSQFQIFLPKDFSFSILSIIDCSSLQTNIQEQIEATVIAIALLRKKENSSYNKWKLIEIKALKFLRSIDSTVDWDSIINSLAIN